MLAFRQSAWLILAASLGTSPVWAGVPKPPPGPYTPDPASVQRFGPAYRYPQSGWTILHIEGSPYERGQQHGKLMATEIAEFVKALAIFRSPDAPAHGWRDQRVLADALFLRKFDPEYLEEMKGIADGAAAAGAKFEGRALDLLDVVALNSDIELTFLDEALNATPNGLEGKRFAEPNEKRPKKPASDHCSAFAATGPATKDGKIVFGHITMWGLYHVRFYNVWLDIKPETGHRVMMQSYPGGIMSGLDYYMNDHGLLVAETTISQTKFDATGAPLASRIRRALQYSDSIDDAVTMLKVANNGLYTNEWLLADTNTNEIAMFELGTHKSRLWRSSRNEWYGNTPGFYWGCNNPKDLDVRLETVPSVGGRPANVVFHPSERDSTWQSLYEKWNGKIDANFGFEAFTTPPLAAFPSCDAKFTTTDMARQLTTYGLYGPPLGKTWDPTPGEKERYHSIRPLIPNDWALLRAEAPYLPGDRKTPTAIDIADEKDGEGHHPDADGVRPPVWHGTLLPATDADIWLAAAFADYERIVGYQKAIDANGDLDETTPAEKLAEGKIHADPKIVLAAKEVCRCERLLDEISKQSGKEGESKLADAKDKLLTARHAYRNALLGRHDDDALALLMFGPRSRYLTAVRRLGRDIPLLETKPELKRDEWYQIASGKGILLLARLRTLMGGEAFDKFMDEFGRGHAGKPASSDEFFAGAETAHGKSLSAVRDQFLKNLPSAAIAQEGFWSIDSFEVEPEQSLIVYGTLMESEAQREAAGLLQRGIERRWRNQTIPIKADTEVTAADLKGRHLLLIGRPNSNSVAAELAMGLPVTFGPRSFVLRGKTYAHAASAVIAAGQHPRDPRHSVVIFAGLGAESTWRCAQSLNEHGGLPAPVLLLQAGESARRLTVPPSPKDLELLGQASATR
jgi:hypothetical protein